jgi:hypothetical protein
MKVKQAILQEKLQATQLALSVFKILAARYYFAYKNLRKITVKSTTVLRLPRKCDVVTSAAN